MDNTIKKIVSGLKKTDAVSAAIVMRALKTIDAKIAVGRDTGEPVDPVALIGHVVDRLEEAKSQIQTAIQSGEAKAIDPFPHLSEKASALEIKRLYRFLKPIHDQMYARVVVRFGNRGRIRQFDVEQRVHGGPETDYNHVARVDLWTALAVEMLFCGGVQETAEDLKMKTFDDTTSAKFTRIQKFATAIAAKESNGGNKKKPASKKRA